MSSLSQEFHDTNFRKLGFTLEIDLSGYGLKRDSVLNTQKSRGNVTQQSQVEAEKRCKGEEDKKTPRPH